MQEANNRAAPSSPGRAARQPLGSTCANTQQHARKRNAPAKKKLQEDLAEQTALVEKLQQQLKAVQTKADADANKARVVMPCILAYLSHTNDTALLMSDANCQPENIPTMHAGLNTMLCICLVLTCLYLPVKACAYCTQMHNMNRTRYTADDSEVHNTRLHALYACGQRFDDASNSTQL